MRFTSSIAKLSLATTAAAFMLIAALWIRSADHADAIIYQGEHSNWSLDQSNGAFSISVPHDPVRGYLDPGFRYVSDDFSWMKRFETICWGRFSCVASFSGPSGPIVSISIPHWFVLCLSAIFLIPAIIHWVLDGAWSPRDRATTNTQAEDSGQVIATRARVSRREGEAPGDFSGCMRVGGGGLSVLSSFEKPSCPP